MNIRNSISLNDRVTPTLKAIMKAMDSTIKVMESIDKHANHGVQSKAYQRAEADIRKANNQLIMMRNHTSLAADGANDVASAWNNVNKTLGKSKSSFGNIFSSIAGGIYTIKSGLRGITSMADVADSAISDTAKLKLFNTSGSSDMQVYGQVYKTAQASRSDLSATAGLAQRIMLSDVYKGKGATRSAIDLAGTINKAMVLGGGSSQENNRAIIQLSQGLSSGLLQGDELRSLREQSPYLAKILAEGLSKIDDKFIGTTIGDLKELGAQGELTSEVVVKALQSMSDQIDETFDTSAPKTFSGAMTSIGNTVKFFISILNQADGPLGKFNQSVWNLADYLSSPQGFEFLSSLIPVLNMVVFAFDALSGTIQFVGNNMSWIAPILGTILGLLAAYNAYLAISKAITWATGIAHGIAAVAAYVNASAQLKAAQAASAAGSAAGASAVAFLTEAQATAAATAAQHGFNAALWASPITWIIVAIIVLIGLIFLIVALVNNATGSTISALGIIVGAVLTVVAIIWNTVVGVINSIIQFFWVFVDFFLGIIEFILNCCMGGFDSFGGAVANLIGQIISWFLTLGKVVTKIIDAIFGTDWTGGLNALQDKVIAWGKNDTAITVTREAPSLKDIGVDRWSYSDAYNTGYDFGSGVQDKIGEFGIDDLSGSISDLPTEITGGNLDSVGEVGSDVNISDEDIKLLRDMAARDYLLQLQTITPVAHVTFGDVRETADVGKIIDVIEQMVEEQMATSLVS